MDTHVCNYMALCIMDTSGLSMCVFQHLVTKNNMTLRFLPTWLWKIWKNCNHHSRFVDLHYIYLYLPVGKADAPWLFGAPLFIRGTSVASSRTTWAVGRHTAVGPRHMARRFWQILWLFF